MAEHDTGCECVACTLKYEPMARALADRESRLCHACGGTGLTDAVLTPEELARAIVHKTVKCPTCEGEGVIG